MTQTITPPPEPTQYAAPCADCGNWANFDDPDDPPHCAVCGGGLRGYHEP